MKILLTTLHAKYVHASLALPCLAAFCADLPDTEILIREFTVNEPAGQILRAVVAADADVVAFSCYIWNIEQTLKLVDDLKRVSPNTFIILGGPEASYGIFKLMERCPAIDCVIRGEGEEAFRECIATLSATASNGGKGHLLTTIAGIVFRDDDELVATPARQHIVDMNQIPSPVQAGLLDFTKPLVYFESSRGCPFSCAFCLSSLEQGVRSFSMQRIMSDLAILMNQGVKTVKFVDRTFNYAATRANEIWTFILENNRSSRFHFEIAADLLTEENLALLETVPAGIFRFEIGVQAAGKETLARVGRESDLEKLFVTVKRLMANTGVIVHLDLVAGLPHEDFAGFMASLQRLLDAWPHFIQVEPLKVLKGSPMRRIADEEGYTFSAAPPYTILQTPWLSFTEIGRIDTIARLLDLYYNSGKFVTTLRSMAEIAPMAHVFNDFAAWYQLQESTPHLAQAALFQLLWDFSVTVFAETRLAVLKDALSFDFCLAEYPAGRLPAFFLESHHPEDQQARETARSLIDKLDIGPGSRIRSFTRRFTRDFRSLPWQTGPVELLFVYISAPGKGLQVEVLKINPE